jgi:hypothetical protein
MNQTLDHLRRTQRTGSVRLIVVASIYAFLTIGFLSSVMRGPDAAHPRTVPASLVLDPVAMR